MNTEKKISIIINAHNAAKTIAGIIDSVKAQSLTSYECIIIGNSTSDNIEGIVNALTDGDERFTYLHQDETYPCAAWNKGIARCSAEYILFCDQHETLTPKALAGMYNQAQKKNADLVIGRIAHSEFGETYEPENIKALCGKETIHPFDRDLISTPSVCNKLFRRRVIIDNDLSFQPLNRYTELAFCLQFEGKCNTISGWNELVCTYGHVPYWEHDKVAVNCTAGVEESLRAFDLCAGIIQSNYEYWKDALAKEENISIKELEVNYERLKSALHSDYVRRVLINGYYRNVWTADADTIRDIKKQVTRFRQFIFPSDWSEEVIWDFPELFIRGDAIADIDDLDSGPEITFAISGAIERESLNKVIKGIYSQNYLLFEVLITGALYDMLEPEYKVIHNLHRIEADDDSLRKAALEKCRSRYIWFVDNPVYLSETSVRRMLNEAEESSDYLFVSAPMTCIDGDRYVRIDANAASFIPEFSRRKLRTDYNQLDYFWSNKLFNVAKLRALKDPFGKGSWETLERFYKYSLYKKTNTVSLLTDLKDEDILKQVRSNVVAGTWESKLREEDEFLKNLETRNKREVSVEEKRRNIRATRKALLFRWFTIRFIYPLVYTFFRLRRVERGKVLFVEPSQLKPTNSMQTMIKAAKDAGFSNVEQISLARNKVRKKEQLNRELHFLKEFATAEFVFTTEALPTIAGFKKRKETTLVNLWHGCGAFKRFGHSTAEMKFGTTAHENRKYPGYRNLDLITVSSPVVIWAYEEAMNYKDADVVKATGISRTDVFFNQDYIAEAKARVLEEVPEATGKKIILYAPTFRGSVRRAKAPDRLDIQALHEALGDDYYLMIKHHPHVKVRPLVPVDCKGFARDVTNELTIDDLLCCTDICISDYSSLVFEYSLFGKPMIFFAYDLEEYNDWRGFYYDYDELTPGPVVMSNEEIIRYVRNIDTEFDKDAVDRFRDRFMSSCDGHATQRILETIGMVQ